MNGVFDRSTNISLVWTGMWARYSTDLKRPRWGTTSANEASVSRGGAVGCRCDDRGIPSTQGVRELNYPRRQQYRRLSRAAATAMASAAAVMLALIAASAGALSAAGTLLVVALGFGLYARHGLSLAGRSGVGARSEDEVRRALAPLQADGWAVRHSLP
jgi:hypothetical protein